MVHSQKHILKHNKIINSKQRRRLWQARSGQHGEGKARLTPVQHANLLSSCKNACNPAELFDDDKQEEDDHGGANNSNCVRTNKNTNMNCCGRTGCHDGAASAASSKTSSDDDEQSSSRHHVQEPAVDSDDPAIVPASMHC
jgi:hypothetical protein